MSEAEGDPGGGPRRYSAQLGVHKILSNTVCGSEAAVLEGGGWAKPAGNGPTPAGVTGLAAYDRSRQ